MASLSRLVSLFVIIITLRRADCGTHAGSQPFPTTPSNKLCLRLCRSVTTQQQKRKGISRDGCIKDCEQRKTPNVPGNENDLLARTQHSVEADNKKKCLGYSDKKERFPPLHPTPTKVLKVAYRAYSSKEHHYNVSWEPFKETDLASGRNWTHYSLLYQFFNRYYEKAHDMDCVLIPKNKTYFVLKHTPLWSANKEPDKLVSAVVPYPFAQTDVKIELHEADPLKPSKMPSFMPVFATSKVSSSHYHFKIGATIVGGAFALMFLVLMAYVWRRRRKCRLRYQGPAREPVCNISIPNNSAEAAAPRNPENAEELYYCCYYPENEAFRNEVASTVNRFRMEGYDVIMDAMVSSEISCMGPTRWAEAQIRRASKVLVFLSPGLLKLASDGCEGMQSQDVNRVWVELELLRDTYVRTRSAAKMVCITLPSLPVNSTDTLLWAKVTYKFPDDYVQILRRLNDRPSILPHIRANDC